MHSKLRLAVCLSVLGLLIGCQTSSPPEKTKGNNCYQPLYWPSEACPPGKK